MAEFFQASYFVSEVIALVGIVLNAFQIFHTIRNNRKQTPFDLSIFSLSVADLLSSSFALIFMIYWHLVHNSVIKNYKIIDTTSKVFLQYCILSSIFHLVFIAVLRVIAVILPFKFRFLVTLKLSYASITTIWLLSLMFSVINVFLVSSDVIGYIVLSAEALFVIIYTTICCAVKKQDSSARKLSAVKHQRPPLFYHTMLHSVYVSSAFILCTLPATLFSVRIVNRVDPSYIYEWVRWMFYLNPTADSFLYFYFTKKMARARKIRITFTNQWSGNFYSLESARKSNNPEMTTKESNQKFAFSSSEVDHKTTTCL